MTPQGHQRKCLLVGILFIFLLIGSWPELAWSAPANESAELRLIYERLLAAFNQGNTLMGQGNLTGAIVWGEAYVLQSFLEMYEATRETLYLERFVRHADALVAQRDDVAGRRDWNGQSRLGWQTAGSYTLGKPVTLLDSDGVPSLEVRGVHSSANDFTTIEVIAEKGERYGLRVVNTRVSTTPVELKFEGLTQKVVEQRVNGNLSPASYIEVRRLSTRPPSPTRVPIRSEPQKVVLSTFHSPFILTPFSWFGYLVNRDQIAKVIGNSRTYLDMAKLIYDQNEPYWEEHSTYGFYRIEPNVPFWAAGLPAPLNAQSAHGLYILYLALATGEQKYMERVNKLAGLIAHEVKVTSGGRYTVHYWFGEGYHGWDETKGQPRPRGNGYPRYKGLRKVEDASHGAWTGQFVWTAHRAGVTFGTADMKRWAMTAHYVVPETAAMTGIVGSLPPLEDMTGVGKPDYKPDFSGAAATWALFAIDGNPTLYERALAVYKAHYTERKSSAAVLLGWASLARLAVELGR